ncbi:MAG: hypothetical protein JJT95_02665 [Pararhodobacter sp.]|nr:hypothetical protein [Pararhodobacter sp.]
MQNAWFCAVILAVIATPASTVLASERQSLGGMIVDIDGTMTDLEVFEGPIGGLHRSLAGYRTNFGGDGGMISIEGVPAQVPAGAHPMQGAAVIRMEFSAPAPLDPSSPHDESSILYIADWLADAPEPGRVYANADVVDLELEELDLSEGEAFIAGTASASMCPHDIETEQTQPLSDACFELTMLFETVLLPFAPPVRLDAADDPQPADDAPATEASPTADDGPATMEVLGRVNARLGNDEREWVTIAGEIRGQHAASANFQRIEISMPGFADTFGAMAGVLSEEEQEQLGMLDQLFTENNPMAAIMEELTGQRIDGSDQISLTISGHDPTSPNILTEQVLALDVHLTSAQPPLGRPIPAEVTYVLEASGGFIPAVFYTSGEGGAEASVSFDRLELGPDGAHATGSFHATICRMEGARLMDGADMSDCMPVEGSFDTALVEEEPFRP